MFKIDTVDLAQIGADGCGSVKCFVDGFGSLAAFKIQVTRPWGDKWIVEVIAADQHFEMPKHLALMEGFAAAYVEVVKVAKHIYDSTSELDAAFRVAQAEHETLIKALRKEAEAAEAADPEIGEVRAAEILDKLADTATEKYSHRASRVEFVARSRGSQHTKRGSTLYATKSRVDYCSTAKAKTIYYVGMDRVSKSHALQLIANSSAANSAFA